MSTNSASRTLLLLASLSVLLAARSGPAPVVSVVSVVSTTTPLVAAPSTTVDPGTLPQIRVLPSADFW